MMTRKTIGGKTFPKKERQKKENFRGYFSCDWALAKAKGKGHSPKEENLENWLERAEGGQVTPAVFLLRDKKRKEFDVDRRIGLVGEVGKKTSEKNECYVKGGGPRLEPSTYISRRPFFRGEEEGSVDVDLWGRFKKRIVP